MNLLEVICLYSDSDSVASPDGADVSSPTELRSPTEVMSPSEVSSGVNVDTTDKLPSPSDSGTVSPVNKGIDGDELLII